MKKRDPVSIGIVQVRELWCAFDWDERQHNEEKNDSFVPEHIWDSSKYGAITRYVTSDRDKFGYHFSYQDYMINAWKFFEGASKKDVIVMQKSLFQFEGICVDKELRGKHSPLPGNLDFLMMSEYVVKDSSLVGCFGRVIEKSADELNIVIRDHDKDPTLFVRNDKWFVKEYQKEIGNGKE